MSVLVTCRCCGAEFEPGREAIAAVTRATSAECDALTRQRGAKAAHA
jgi:hypothetical protein